MASSIDKTLSGLRDPALLLSRLLIAALFAVAAYGKWPALAGVSGYLAKLGVPAPAVMAPVVAAFETIVAIMLIVGFQTRLAALGVAAFCIFSAFLAHFDLGNQAQQTQFLKNFAIAGGALALMIAGAGAYSMDKK